MLYERKRYKTENGKFRQTARNRSDCWANYPGHKDIKHASYTITKHHAVYSHTNQPRISCLLYKILTTRNGKLFHAHLRIDSEPASSQSIRD